MSTPNPVLVQVTRGGAVESIHRGRAVVMEASGRVVAAWGDVESPIFPRSAVKPLQALALIESGAAEALGITDAEIAIACASHAGEAAHTKVVSRWLERLSLGSQDLECGAHAPRDTATARALLERNAHPSALHNNCSGKHTGFLATARHLGLAIKGYTAPTHGVQEGWIRVLAEMSGADLSETIRGTDGCSIPTVALPLAALARAMARLADPSALAPERAAAARRITLAMTRHPHLVGGRKRFDTAAIEAGRGAFIVKVGAEGVYAAALLKAGLGVALKIDDGARRAAEVAVTALLDHLGVLDHGARKALAGSLEPPVLSIAGKPVGTIRPAPGWPA